MKGEVDVSNCNQLHKGEEGVVETCVGEENEDHGQIIVGGSVEEVLGERNLDHDFVETKMEGDSDHFISDKGWEDGDVSTTPTRTRSQKWTLSEIGETCQKNF